MTRRARSWAVVVATAVTVWAGVAPGSPPPPAEAAVGEAHVAVRDGFVAQPIGATLSPVNGGIGVDATDGAGLAVTPPGGQTLQAGPPVVVGPEGGSTIWYQDPCFGRGTKLAQILQVETDGATVQRFAARTYSDCGDGFTSSHTVAYHATVDVPAVAIAQDPSYGSSITLTTRVGRSVRHLVTISNVGNTPTPARLAFRGAAVPGVTFDDGTCGATVAPGVTCQLGLVFRPESAGTVQSRPIVVSDATEWAGPGIGTPLPQDMWFIGRAAPPPGDALTPIDPVRLLDTRFGIGAPIGALDQSPLRVQIAGRGGVPADATAVVANLTVTETTGEGFLTVWPSGEERPLVSNLNFRRGDTVPNSAVLALGADGGLQVFNSSGLSHVIIDVVAWMSPFGDLVYSPYFAPFRIADTRDFGNQHYGTIGPGEERSLRVALSNGRAAEAAVVNITGIEPTAATHLTVYGKNQSTPLPNASTLNLRPGEIRANLAIVNLADLREITIYNNSGRTHVVVDVLGVLVAADDTATAGRIVPLSPFRSTDTREADDVFGPHEAGGYRFPTEIGTLGVEAIVFNATVTEPTRPGFLTLFPWTDQRIPFVSTLNFTAGQTIPNAAWARLPPAPDNLVGVYNGSSGNTHVVLDIQAVVLR